MAMPLGLKYHRLCRGSLCLTPMPPSPRYTTPLGWYLSLRMGMVRLSACPSLSRAMLRLLFSNRVVQNLLALPGFLTAG